MRRTCLALLGIILISLLMPPNALALIDWLEHMSGPGRFRGYGVQVKLFCFGKEDSKAIRNLNLRLSLRKTLIEQINEITRTEPTLVAYETILDRRIDRQGYFTNGVGNTGSVPPTLAAMALALDAQNNPELATAQAISLTLGDIVTTTIRNDFLTRVRCQMTIGREFCTEIAAISDNTTRRQQIVELLQRAQATADTLAETERDSLISSFGGNDFSGCQDDKALKRTTSLNLAIQNMRAAGKDGGYAGGNDIRLITLVPTIVWNPLRAMNTKWDFFDFGAGAGMYTFSSGAGIGTFDHFLGWIVEPVRVNAHASKAITERHWWLAVPSYTLGLMLFSKGIEGGAFGDLGGNPSPRIQGEWVKSSSIFFDASPFIHWMQERTRKNAAF